MVLLSTRCSVLSFFSFVTLFFHSSLVPHMMSTYSPMNFVNRNSSISMLRHALVASHVLATLSSWASTIDVRMTESVRTVGERHSDLVLHSFCFFPFAQVSTFKESSSFIL